MTILDIQNNQSCEYSFFQNFSNLRFFGLFLPRRGKKWFETCYIVLHLVEQDPIQAREP